VQTRVVACALCASALATALASASCGKNDARVGARDAAAAPKSAPTFVPAPDSSLARELGTDDAGRGEYKFFDDGPWCGSPPRVDRKKVLGSTVGPESYGPGAPALPDTVGFFETAGVPPDGPAGERDAGGGMRVRLTLAGPHRAAADKPIALTLELANGGATVFTFGVAVDGSFEHWRAPFVDLYARDEATGKTYRWTHGAAFGRCGNVNTRRATDYVKLAPGKKKADPFGDWSHDVLRYTLWVVYAACRGAELGEPLYPDEPAPPDLFEGTIASNALTLEVGPRR
jgi:hypothetical protein